MTWPQARSVRTPVTLRALAAGAALALVMAYAPPAVTASAPWAFQTLDGSGYDGQPANAIDQATAAVWFGGALHVFAHDSDADRIRHLAYYGGAWHREDLEPGGSSLSAVVWAGELHLYFAHGTVLRHLVWSGGRWVGQDLGTVHKPFVSAVVTPYGIHVFAFQTRWGSDDALAHWAYPDASGGSWGTPSGTGFAPLELIVGVGDAARIPVVAAGARLDVLVDPSVGRHLFSTGSGWATELLGPGEHDLLRGGDGILRAVVGNRYGYLLRPGAWVWQVPMPDYGAPRLVIYRGEVHVFRSRVLGATHTCMLWRPPCPAVLEHLVLVRGASGASWAVQPLDGPGSAQEQATAMQPAVPLVTADGTLHLFYGDIVALPGYGGGPPVAENAILRHAAWPA